MVDERSITEIKPYELTGYTQCHFFAGIGGWPLALALAGWPADRPVWTGSCPCQPFSEAGEGKGTDDPRHLWPVWFPLIRECAPPVVFGEQVASKAALGWLDGVYSDLEGAGYAVGAKDLCSAGVGSPNIRQRIFWVSVADSERRNAGVGGTSGIEGGAGLEQRPDADRRGGNDSGWERVVFDHECDEEGNYPVCGTEFDACGCPGPTREDLFEYDQRAGGLYARRLVNAGVEGLEGFLGDGDYGHESGRIDAIEVGPVAAAGGAGAWSRFVVVACADGKARRIEPGLEPLAHGIPARVVRLRGYGNAINPYIAAEFVGATLEALDAA